MKMTQPHYDHMKSAIALIWTQGQHDTHRQFIINEGKAKDIEKRLRHDWKYSARLTRWICDDLYSYLDDTHIDTALKRMMKELQAQR